jgi:WD40 repeat protein
MTDRLEARLAATLNGYADGGVRGIDPLAIAQQAIPKPFPIFGFRFIAAPSRAVRVALVAVLLLALLAAAIAAGALRQRQGTDLPHGNGAILLPLNQQGDDGTIALRVLAPDGTTSDLTLPVHSRSCPTFSPDGAQLAYLSASTPGVDLSEHLAVANADGTEPRALWSGRFNDQTFHQVVWSRDSRHVAASRATSEAYPNTGDRLVIGHRDGSPATVLDWGVGEFPGGLTWSPDGRRLAAIVGINDSTDGIEVRDLDGSPPRAIVTAPDIGAIAWSPDGTTIAYSARSVATNARRDLYFVDASDPHPVAVQAGSPGSESLMAWSPDGSMLAVLVFDSGSPQVGTFSTRVIDRNGVDLHRLGPFPLSSNLFFTWSPDGRFLLYTGGGATADIAVSAPMIVPVDGTPGHTIDIPANDFYTQCPLTWQAVAP